MDPEQKAKEKAAADLLLTQEILNSVCQNTAEGIEILKKSVKERNIRLVFGVAMIERLQNGTEGLRVLFKEYVHSHHRFDFSIGIVLRSLLLDYMIMLNVLEIMDRDNTPDVEKIKEMDDFCLRMLSDSAIYALKYFQANSDTLYGEKKKSILAQLVQNHPFCFEPYANDGSIPVLKVNKSYSQAELVKRLKNSEKYKHLSRKEDWYMYYSKYDHFGAMYLSLSAQHIAKQFDNMCSAIRELPYSLILMISYLCSVFPNNELLAKHQAKCLAILQKIEKMENETTPSDSE